MPRVQAADPVYKAAEMFRHECLELDGSLIFPGTALWTLPNLEKLHAHFVDKPDESDRRFLEKFEEQLRPAGPDVVRLAAEVIAIYYLFPDTILARTKRAQIETVLNWANIKAPAESVLWDGFERGIGGTGQAFNQRKPNELWFVINFALEWKRATPEVRAKSLANAVAMQGFVDGVDDADHRQMRHALLHLLYPDDFEPIASANHKSRIRDVFGALLSERSDNADDELRGIRIQLQKLLDRPAISFYERQIRMAWDPSDADDD